MASERVLVEFVVDSTGAVRAVQTLKGELGTELPKSAAAASSSIGAMSVAIGQLTAQLATAGFRAMVDFFQDSSRAAMEEERVMQRLAVTVENAGIKWSQAGGQVRQMLASIQDTTRYADDQAAGALQTLIGITGNYEASVKSMTAAIDLAAGRNMDLEAAAQLVGKAVAGNTGSLGRYGIVLSDTEKKMLAHASATERAEYFAKLFGERFGGAAQRDLQTVGGQLDRLTNHFDDLKEKIGQTINEQLFRPEVIEPLIQQVDRLAAQFTTWLAESAKNIPAMVERLGNILSIVVDLIPAFVTLAETLATIWAIQKLEAFVGMMKTLPALLRAASAETATLATKMSTYAAILGATTIAAQAFAAWMDRLAKLDGYAQSLEKTSREQVAFYEAVKMTGLSLADLSAKSGKSAEEIFKVYLEMKKTGAINDTWAQIMQITNHLLAEQAETTSTVTTETSDLSDTLDTELEPSLLRIGKAGSGLISGVADYASAWRTAIGEVPTLFSTFITGVSREQSEKLIKGIEDYAQEWKDKEPVIRAAVAAPIEGLYTTGGDLQKLMDAWAKARAQEMGDVLASGLVDAITAVFSGGDWSDVFESFTSQLTQIFSRDFQEAVSNLFSGAGFSTGQRDADGNIIAGTGTTGQAWAAGLGVAGGALSSYGQSRGNQTMGALGGAMSGAAAGMPFGPWGIAIGAILGGVMGYLGSQGDDVPESSYSIGPGGGMLSTRGGQGYTSEMQQAWAQQAYTLYRGFQSTYLDTLSLFQRPELFGMLGGLPSIVSDPTSAGGDRWVEGSAQQILQQLTQDILPDLFESWAGQAIGAGLTSYGVGSGTQQQLWSELGMRTGTDRVAALQTYIKAVVDSATLLEQADWADVTRRVGQTDYQQMLEAAGDMFGELETAFAAMEGMDLLQRAEQAQEIETVLESALSNWLQYLRQIDAEEKAMRRSIQQQIESIQLTGMSSGQIMQYARGQIEDLMAQLGTADPGAVGTIVGDIQRYVSMLQQAAGDQLWTLPGPSGTPLAVWLMEILRQTEEIAGGRYEEARDRVAELVDQTADELERLRDALGVTNDWLTGGPYSEWGPGTNDGNEGGNGDWEDDPNRKPGQAPKSITAAIYEVADAVSTMAPPVVNITIDGSIAPLITLIQQVIAGSQHQSTNGQNGIM